MYLIETLIIFLLILVQFLFIGFVFVLFKLKGIEQSYVEHMNTINMLGQKLKNSIERMPTPEQLAKEILKVKLPLSEAPPEVLEQMQQEYGGQLPPTQQAEPTPEASNYIG